MSSRKSIFAVLALCGLLSACVAGGSVKVNYDAPKPNKPSKLVYGNYCGLGTRYGTLATFPIDNLDAACREHDACYIEGKDHCFCDGTLVVAARELSQDPAAEKRKKVAAELVMKMFSTKFCRIFPSGLARPHKKDILKTRIVAPRNSTI